MNPKTLTTLAIALGCGVLAMFGIKQATDNGGKSEAEPTVKVLTAVVDIPVGRILNDTMVTFKTTPVSAVPPGAITTPEEYENRALKIPAIAGEPILALKLGQLGQSGIGMMIPEGYRIVQLKANGTTGFSGLIRPGSRVDVLVTFETDVRQAGSNRTTKVLQSKTLFEYVEVFSVNADTTAHDMPNRDGEETSRKVADVEQIGLLFKPEEADIFTLAKEKATIHLTWRNELDKADVRSGVVDQSILNDLHIGGPDMATTKANYPVAVAPEEEEFEQELTDFQSFLDDVEEEDIDKMFTPAPVVEPVKVAAKPKWTMHIYSGGNKDSVTVDLQKKEAAAERQRQSTPKKPAAAANANDLQASGLSSLGRISTSTGETDQSGQVNEGELNEAEDSTDWLGGLAEKFLPGN